MRGQIHPCAARRGFPYSVRMTIMQRLLVVVCMLAEGCAAEPVGENSAAGESAARGDEGAKLASAAARGNAQPAIACTQNCDCTLGNFCSDGTCTGIIAFSPAPPPPYCAGDCQCPGTAPFCNGAFPDSTCHATRCTHAISSKTVAAGGTATYSWQALGGGSKVVLLGKKNGVPDETGQTVLPSLSGSFLVGNTPGKAGSYERHLSVRTTQDVEVCKSDSIFFTFQ